MVTHVDGFGLSEHFWNIRADPSVAGRDNLYDSTPSTSFDRIAGSVASGVASFRNSFPLGK